MRLIFALLLIAIPCFPGQSEKPPCNAQNRGRFWPDEANTDRAAARRAERCGEIQLCSLGIWKYSWMPLTIHFSQLSKTRIREIPGCERGAEKAPGLVSDSGSIGRSVERPAEAEAGEQASAQSVREQR